MIWMRTKWMPRIKEKKSEIKILLDGINSRLDIAEEKNGEPEGL